MYSFVLQGPAGKRGEQGPQGVHGFQVICSSYWNSNCNSLFPVVRIINNHVFWYFFRACLEHQAHLESQENQVIRYDIWLSYRSFEVNPHNINCAMITAPVHVKPT